MTRTVIRNGETARVIRRLFFLINQYLQPGGSCLAGAATFVALATYRPFRAVGVIGLLREPHLPQREEEARPCQLPEFFIES